MRTPTFHGRRARVRLPSQNDSFDSWSVTRGGELVGLNPNIRVYRYQKGQYFDCHCELASPNSFTSSAADHSDDDSNDLILPTEPRLAARTTWTLLLYLTSSTEGCVGGETVFYPHDRQLPSEEIAVSLETGTLLLHKHGHECLLVRQLEIVLPRAQD